MMKEYSPALFLASANTSVIGTTMLELWVQGNTGSVAALATIQIVITAVFVAAGQHLHEGTPGCLTSRRRPVEDFGDVPVLNDITFTIEDGEFFTLLGPSGLRQVHDPELHRRPRAARPADGSPSARRLRRHRARRSSCRRRSATSAWCSRATPCGRT